jgi:AcrR family transcriptional regulator
MTAAMSDVKDRAAKQPSRRDRARATRGRITKAAYALFCERGYSGTTMSDIAEAAGVAVQTVYFVFHTKSELLSRTYDFAVLGEDEPLPPEQQAWYRAMTAQANVGGAVLEAVRGIGTILARATPLDTVVRGSAASDPEAAQIRQRHEGWRAAGYRAMLDVLRTKSPLRAGMSAERATHLLLLYIGMDTYRVLVHDFGWPHEEWIAWTTTTVAEQVFGVPPAD